MVWEGPNGKSFGSLPKDIASSEDAYQRGPDFVSALSDDASTIVGFLAKDDMFLRVGPPGREVLVMNPEPIPVYSDDGATQLGTWDGGFYPLGGEPPAAAPDETVIEE